MRHHTSRPKPRAKPAKLKSAVVYLPSRTVRRIEHLAAATAISTTQLMSDLVNVALRVKGIKVLDNEEAA